MHYTILYTIPRSYTLYSIYSVTIDYGEYTTQYYNYNFTALTKAALASSRLLNYVIVVLRWM